MVLVLGKELLWAKRKGEKTKLLREVKQLEDLSLTALPSQSKGDSPQGLLKWSLRKK